MKRLPLLLALAIVAGALAGCTNDGGSTTTPTATSPAGTAPTATTPTSPTPAVVGTAASVRVTSAPPRASPGTNATVCWEVAGSGKVAHTAIHHDTLSHPGDNVTFDVYTGGLVFPDNRTTPAPEGYALPGHFCTNAPMPASGTLYLRAHVLDSSPGKGKVSNETGIATGGLAEAITLTTAPTTAAAGSQPVVCWRIEGSGNVAHTAIHHDATSHPEPGTTFDAYTGGLVFPDNRTAPAAEGYALPGTFCTLAPMPQSGTLYLRAHVLDSRGGKGIVTDEHAIAVG